MSAVLDYLNLCRLCLVKDKVNIAIFDETNDVPQLFLKISACLPVKVAQDDRLPKKICDSCLYKVDLLYQFWNTTISSEKQLLQWCGGPGGSGGDEGVTIKGAADTLMLPQSHAHPHSIHTETIILKEERPDSADTKLVDGYGPELSTPTATVSASDLYSEEFALSYQQQQQLTEATANYTGSASNQTTQKKRPRGRPPGSTKKKRQSTRSRARRDSVEDSEDDRPLAAAISDQDDHLNSAAGLQITKEEAESDEDYVDNTESLEPTTFVAVPSTSACELPGPSGLVTKGSTTSASTEPGCRRDNIFPFSMWDNNNETSSEVYGEKLTIKVEPIDINWDDEEMTLMDLKNKMGLLTASPKRKRKRKTTTTTKNNSKNKNSSSSSSNNRTKTCSSKVTVKSQKYTCALCSTVVRGRTALINHYLVHKDMKIKENMATINKYHEDEDMAEFYKCCVCMKEFPTKALLDKHSEYHVDRPFYCERCNKCFKQTQNFLTHMDSHQHNTELKCAVCEFSTTFKLAYDRHMKRHAREEYRCPLCDKVFAARTWYLEHKNYHTGERPFSCEECGKCFPYSRYLTAHKKSMHPHCYFKEPELNECQICKKRYSHKNSLRLHMKIHTGDNRYLCDVCGKSLSSTDKLQLHKRIHSGYKPYACTVCEKRFTKKDILTDHIRVHSGEKPFACETCGKCFSQRSPLTIHKRYHTGERPYVCHLCNKGFVSKGILGIHLKQVVLYLRADKQHARWKRGRIFRTSSYWKYSDICPEVTGTRAVWYAGDGVASPWTHEYGRIWWLVSLRIWLIHLLYLQQSSTHETSPHCISSGPCRTCRDAA